MVVVVKLSNAADQSKRTILVKCIGASFWYKFLERA